MTPEQVKCIHLPARPSTSKLTVLDALVLTFRDDAERVVAPNIQALNAIGVMVAGAWDALVAEAAREIHAAQLHNLEDGIAQWTEARRRKRAAAR